MTGKTLDGQLDLRVHGKSWKKKVTPPLFLHLLPSEDELWAISTDQSGGLRGGDRQRTSIEVTGGGRLKWSPACAALYHSSTQKESKCTVKQSLSVDRHSRLAFRPQASIPCFGSSIDQHTSIRLEPGAELFYWDVWTCGRAASGERWKFDSISNELELFWGERKIFQERWNTKGLAESFPYDPAGFQGASMWLLAIASGDWGYRLLNLDLAFWKSQGGWGEIGELIPGIWIARALSPQAWQFRPLS